ncbi:hypothetical protein Tco_1243979 [Tanacetum coccineum]
MTPESVQAMIDQALLRNSTNGDGSHSSHGDNRRNSSRPKTLDETIELANDLMDQKLCTYAKRQTDSKRKDDNSSRNNHGQSTTPSRDRMSPGDIRAVPRGMVVLNVEL